MNLFEVIPVVVAFVGGTALLFAFVYSKDLTVLGAVSVTYLLSLITSCFIMGIFADWGNER